MERKNVRLGLLGVAGGWVSYGFSVPLINVLKDLSPAQLLLARGAVTTLLVLAIAPNTARGTNRKLMLVGAAFGAASLGLFNGVRELGPSRLTIMQALVPVFLLLHARIRGRQIGGAPVVCFLLAAITGVAIALQPWTWNWRIAWTGYAWGLFTALMNATYIETLTEARECSFMQRGLWQGLGATAVGLLTSVHANWTPLATPPTLVLVVCVGLLFGFCNFAANNMATRNIPSHIFGVLALGETPVTIGFSGLILGEFLSPLQWTGVILALAGIGLLGRWQAKQVVR